CNRRLTPSLPSAILLVQRDAQEVGHRPFRLRAAKNSDIRYQINSSGENALIASQGDGYALNWVYPILTDQRRLEVATSRRMPIRPCPIHLVSRCPSICCSLKNLDSVS